MIKEYGQPSEYPGCKRMSHKEKSKRKTRRMFLTFLLMIFVASVIAVMCTTILFNIETIELNGEIYYDMYDVIDKSNIAIGDNLFLINTKEAKEEILNQLVYVDDVEIAKQLPTKITIDAKPAKAAAVVKNGDKYIIISERSKILEKDIGSMPTDIPLLVGIDLSKFSVAEYVDNSMVTNYNIIEDVMESLSKYNINDVNCIDITNPMDIKIRYDNRIDILLGSRNKLGYKIEFVNKLLRDEIKPYEEGTIDARLTLQNQMMFRPKREEYVAEASTEETSEADSEEDNIENTEE